MAWKRRSRPCLAVPPADSPSTRKSSQRSGSFSWQSASLPGTTGIERAFAPCEIASFPGSFPRAGGVDALRDDLSHDRGVLIEVLAQPLVHELNDLALNIAVQFALGLALKLRLRQLDAHDGGQTFAHVVAGQVLFHVFEQSRLLAIEVDGAG